MRLGHGRVRAAGSMRDPWRVTAAWKWWRATPEQHVAGRRGLRRSCMRANAQLMAGQRHTARWRTEYSCWPRRVLVSGRCPLGAWMSARAKGETCDEVIALLLRQPAQQLALQHIAAPCRARQPWEPRGARFPHRRCLMHRQARQRPHLIIHPADAYEELLQIPVDLFRLQLLGLHGVAELAARIGQPEALNGGQVLLGKLGHLGEVHVSSANGLLACQLYQAVARDLVRLEEVARLEGDGERHVVEGALALNEWWRVRCDKAGRGAHARHGTSSDTWVHAERARLRHVERQRHRGEERGCEHGPRRRDRVARFPRIDQ
eukprot:scaffold9107_cov112-Isochrysis_galbana.AAC.11